MCVVVVTMPGVWNRARMDPGGNQPGDVGHVGHHDRPDLIGDGPDAGEIDDPGVGTGADHDQLRRVLPRESCQLVVVDSLVVPSDAVGDDGIELPREVQRMAVGQVTTVREVHPQHRVTRSNQGKVGRHVGLCARVGLDVGMLGAKERPRPFDSQ